jgi:beta-phosphoglucomutase-like phosphatase (HAD superfamily)
VKKNYQLEICEVDEDAWRSSRRSHMAMNRAVLWDMDGTLVDSAEYHWRAWCHAMSREGFPVTHEQFLATFGQRNDSILRQWLGQKATPELIQRIGNAKEALYRKLVREQGIATLPGASEWVDLLHRQGWGQAIASAAPRANIQTILDTLQAARAAGMKSIGVSQNGQHLPADIVVRSLDLLEKNAFDNLLLNGA